MPTPTLLQVIPSIAESAFEVCMSLAIVSFVWTLWEAFQKGSTYLSSLHQIPCARCTFFTGEYNIKCTVHPFKALNEAAIDCPDYKPPIGHYSK